MPVQQPARPPGRPRNESAGPAILRVTRQLVAQHGYESVTTQMIADAAGTGKQTIYRRWPSKAELVLSAFVEHAETAIDRTSLSRRRKGTETLAFLKRLFKALDETGPAVRGLMAYAQNDPEFRNLFYQRLIGPRREALRRVLENDIAANKVSNELDLDTAVTVIYGAMWYRLLLDEPLNDSFAVRLTHLLPLTPQVRRKADF